MFAELVTRGRRVPAATSFLVGRLVERDQRDFEKCRRRFSKAYRRIKRRRWRALSEAMREQARATSAVPASAPRSLMDVYLVRHAIAHERNRARWPKDALRPLTAAGKQKFRKAARGLARLVPKSAQVFTSPYVRARDTAAILAGVAKLRAARSKRPELAAGEPARKAFELLRIAQVKAAVVLVGHEPNLSTLLSAALAGERARLKIEFKKGGAACLAFAGSDRSPVAPRSCGCCRRAHCGSADNRPRSVRQRGRSSARARASSRSLPSSRPA